MPITTSALDRCQCVQMLRSLAHVTHLTASARRSIRRSRSSKLDATAAARLRENGQEVVAHARSYAQGFERRPDLEPAFLGAQPKVLRRRLRRQRRLKRRRGSSAGQSGD
mmetsp:Transcript_34974/g.111733  ORF Transcript_34974/g.111733 Transcript_34974/m.111733 type:complete len:110 (+) Transcript_34974:340-669(+)